MFSLITKLTVKECRFVAAFVITISAQQKLVNFDVGETELKVTDCAEVLKKRNS